MSPIISSWVGSPQSSTHFAKESISPALVRLRRNILARYNIRYLTPAQRRLVQTRGSTNRAWVLNNHHQDQDPEHILPDDPELYILEHNESEKSRKVLYLMIFKFFGRISICKEIPTVIISSIFFQEIPVITIHDEDEPVGASPVWKSPRVWNGRGIQAVLTKSSNGRLVYSRPIVTRNITPEPQESTRKKYKERKPRKQSARRRVRQDHSKRKTNV